MTKDHSPIIRAKPFDIDANSISKEDHNSRNDYEEDGTDIVGVLDTLHCRG
jgi:hypothetical protein